MNAIASGSLDASRAAVMISPRAWRATLSSVETSRSPKSSHRQRARDRRGGHHQHIRRHRLLDRARPAGARRTCGAARRSPPEPEARELHPFVQQRVRAHDDCASPRWSNSARRASLLARSRAPGPARQRAAGPSPTLPRPGAQPDAHAQRLQPPLEIEVTPLRQGYAWAPSTARLGSGLHRQQHGRESATTVLPRADIPVPEAGSSAGPTQGPPRISAIARLCAPVERERQAPGEKASSGRARTRSAPRRGAGRPPPVSPPRKAAAGKTPPPQAPAGRRPTRPNPPGQCPQGRCVKHTG